MAIINTHSFILWWQKPVAQTQHVRSIFSMLGCFPPVGRSRGPTCVTASILPSTPSSVFIPGQGLGCILVVAYKVLLKKKSLINNG